MASPVKNQSINTSQSNNNNNDTNNKFTNFLYKLDIKTISLFFFFIVSLIVSYLLYRKIKETNKKIENIESTVDKKVNTIDTSIQNQQQFINQKINLLEAITAQQKLIINQKMDEFSTVVQSNITSLKKQQNEFLEKVNTSSYPNVMNNQKRNSVYVKQSQPSQPSPQTQQSQKLQQPSQPSHPSQPSQQFQQPSQQFQQDQNSPQFMTNQSEQFNYDPSLDSSSHNVKISSLVSSNNQEDFGNSQQEMEVDMLELDTSDYIKEKDVKQSIGIELLFMNSNLPNNSDVLNIPSLIEDNENEDELDEILKDEYKELE